MQSFQIVPPDAEQAVTTKFTAPPGRLAQAALLVVRNSKSTNQTSLKGCQNVMAHFPPQLLENEVLRIIYEPIFESSAK